LPLTQGIECDGSFGKKVIKVTSLATEGAQHGNPSLGVEHAGCVLDVDTSVAGKWEWTTIDRQHGMVHIGRLQTRTDYYSMLKTSRGALKY
jgi:hypothetical protein